LIRRYIPSCQGVISGADRDPSERSGFPREISRLYLFDAGSRFGAFSQSTPMPPDPLKIQKSRKMGLGVVVEYANQSGEPQWQNPPESPWDYGIFGTDRPVPAPDRRLELLFEKIPGGRGGYNRWTMNGRSWPATNPLLSTETGNGTGSL
jgi:hypothetical protein